DDVDRHPEVARRLLQEVSLLRARVVRHHDLDPLVAGLGHVSEAVADGKTDERGGRQVRAECRVHRSLLFRSGKRTAIVSAGRRTSGILRGTPWNKTIFPRGAASLADT